MRLIAFVVAATLAGSLPAHAAWKEFVYPDLGIAKYFPVEPKMEKGTYGQGIRLPLSKIVPDTVLTAVDDGVTYKMIVVDFKGRETEGSNIMGEAISWLGTKGEVVNYGFPRLDLGKDSVYGLILTVDEKGGDHTTSAVFFNKGKLYIMQASAAKNSSAASSPGIGRFMETIRFHLQGYGFANGHDFPIGDDDPNDRDTGLRPAPAANAPAADAKAD